MDIEYTDDFGYISSIFESSIEHALGEPTDSYLDDKDFSSYSSDSVQIIDNPN